MCLDSFDEALDHASLVPFDRTAPPVPLLDAAKPRPGRPLSQVHHLLAEFPDQASCGHSAPLRPLIHHSVSQTQHPEAAGGTFGNSSLRIGRGHPILG
jgi:hypothetical protein